MRDPPSVATATEGCCQLIFRRHTEMYKLQGRGKPRPYVEGSDPSDEQLTTDN